MASHDDEADLQASSTPGYKVSGPAKSPEEYAKMDENDESLKRWKQSLGISMDGTANTASFSGPKVTMISMELVSDSLPPEKKIVLDLQDKEFLVEVKKNPITIKEGIEYNVRMSFRVNHSIISYIQVVKRAGVRVDKLEQMLGSYGPQETPYVKNFNTEESPSGMIARSGTYNVSSRVVDDDGEIYTDFQWSFKLAKEW